MTSPSRLAEAVRSPPPSPDPALCPFPGPASYTLLQADSFHGREVDQMRVAAMLRNEQFSVLTAPSGAGKTSLLHAGVVREMLAEGTIIAVTEPYGGRNSDPLLNVVRAIDDRLFIRSDDIAYCMKQVDGANPGMTLGEAQRRIRLPASRMKRDAATRGKPLSVYSHGPLWSWLILAGDDGGVDDRLVFEALGLQQPSTHAPLESWTFSDVHRSSAAAEFPEPFLPSKGIARCGEAIAWLDRAMLRSNLWSRGRRVKLVIDQFEEIYNSANKEKRAHRRRELVKFIRLLTGNIHGTGDDDALPVGSGAAWRDIDVMISLRKEYWADLAGQFEWIGSLGEKTWHLSPLGREAAEDALEQLDARLSGSKWRTWRRRLIKAMDDGDDEGVSAWLLSVIGEHLWNKGVDTAVNPEIWLGYTVDNIVKSYFSEFDQSDGTLAEAYWLCTQLFDVSVHGNPIRRHVQMSELDGNRGWLLRKCRSMGRKLSPLGEIIETLSKHRVIRDRKMGRAIGRRAINQDVSFDIAHERLARAIHDMIKSADGDQAVVTVSSLSKVTSTRELESAISLARSRWRGDWLNSANSEGRVLDNGSGSEQVIGDIAILYYNRKRLQIDQYVAARLLTDLLRYYDSRAAERGGYEKFGNNRYIEVVAWLEKAARTSADDLVDQDLLGAAADCTTAKLRLLNDIALQRSPEAKDRGVVPSITGEVGQLASVVDELVGERP